MGFSLFRKSKNDDFIKPPIRVEPTQNTNESEPAPETDGPGHMVVEDVFLIKGRGVVVTGRIDSGSFHVDQDAVIKTAHGDIQTTIVGLESFHKTHEFASAGENVGIVLAKNVTRDDVQRGNVITTL